MNFFSVLDDSDNEEAPKVVPAKKGKDAATPAAAAPAKKDAAPAKKDAAPAKKDAAPKAPKADAAPKKGKFSLQAAVTFALQLTFFHCYRSL